jgi:protein-disulfide isomerase
MSRKTARNRPNPNDDSAATARAGHSDRKGWLIATAVVVVAIVAFAAMMWGGGDPPAAADVGGSRDAALASAHAPTLGPQGAKVHIVEFLDPACETCAQFYPMVKQWLAEHPEQIRLSLRHVAFHDGAEYAVRVLEASRKQDKYWQTLETLLATQATWAPHHTVQPDLVLQAIAPVGLDMARLETDMTLPEVTQRIAQDRADAMLLKVTATPEYFVNGRPLPPFGAGELQALVSEELQKNQ